MSDTAGRFQVLMQTQLLAPGKCISCGSADNGRSYIDFEVPVDYYGQVYFCTDCFSSIATDLHWTPNLSLEAIRVFYADMEQQRNNLLKENKALKNVLVTIFSNDYPQYDDIRMFADKLLFDVLDAQAPTKPNLFIPEQSTGPDESNDVEGPDDLRSTSADSDDDSDSASD